MENWRQFTLLVLINGFVGGMVGLERTILPELAETEFGIEANSAILSFIVVFGVAKAIANYVAGALASKVGRKRLLVIGWWVGLPVPFMLMAAPTWNWVVAANLLLGIHQGLTWSSTVVMKIDLVGERNRGLAMGLNESAGYLAVGGVAFFTGWVAAEHGLRPYPFYMGIGFAVIGLVASWWLVQDTRHHVDLETQSSQRPLLTRVFWETTWKNRNLGSITQAGLVNNLNDGMMWGLLPIVLASKGFDLADIGRIVAIYPIVWGLGQLITGKLADHLVKRSMLFWGMLMQGAAILGMVWAGHFAQFIAAAVVLGVGTATVYPTFLAAISEYTHPLQRAQSIGIFRLWRDLGYAFGALLTGLLADFTSLEGAVAVVGLLTVSSAVVVRVRMLP